jgi:hypothetical protein
MNQKILDIILDAGETLAMLNPMEVRMIDLAERSNHPELIPHIRAMYDGLRGDEVTDSAGIETLYHLDEHGEPIHAKYPSQDAAVGYQIISDGEVMSRMEQLFPVTFIPYGFFESNTAPLEELKGLGRYQRHKAKLKVYDDYAKTLPPTNIPYEPNHVVKIEFITREMQKE